MIDRLPYDLGRPPASSLPLPRNIRAVPFVASTIVPIFILIAVGYTIARSKILPTSAADGLSAFVFVVAMPLLLFRTIATAEFGEASPLLLWAAYFSAVAVVFGLGILAGRRIGGMDRRSSVIAGVAASFSNIVLVGVPVTERAFGRPGLDVIALLLAVHLPVMATASTLLMERAAYRDDRAAGIGGGAFRPLPVLKRVGLSLAKNPLIIGIVAGIVVRLTGVPLVGPLGDVVFSLAGTAGPLALVTLGLSLSKYGIGRDLAVPSIVAALALLVQPAVVALFAWALGLPPLWLTIAVIAAACPSGVNAYLFALFFKVDATLSATSIVATTVLSAATLSLWLVWLTG